MITGALRRTALVLLGVLLGTLVITGCGGGNPWAGRTASVDPSSGLPYIDVDQLPVQARQTITLIDAGGPFPYQEDGSMFANREGILPTEPRGYYREYTVVTPGSQDRGARRIVGGDHGRILYYTDDHYASFSRIRR
ncbi:MAG: ribonuclease [Microlunatus sp.]|nr:ribonuclease [Microlunatus sp.]